MYAWYITVAHSREVIKSSNKTNLITIIHETTQQTLTHIKWKIYWHNNNSYSVYVHRANF